MEAVVSVNNGWRGGEWSVFQSDFIYYSFSWEIGIQTSLQRWMWWLTSLIPGRGRGFLWVRTVSPKKKRKTEERNKTSLLTPVIQDGAEISFWSFWFGVDFMALYECEELRLDIMCIFALLTRPRHDVIELDRAKLWRFTDSSLVIPMRERCLIKLASSWDWIRLCSSPWVVGMATSLE